MKRAGIAVTACLVCLAAWAGLDSAGAGTRYYSIVGAGVSWSDSWMDDMAYHASIVSPWVQVGAPVDRWQLLGFDARFCIDPTDTTSINSIMLSAVYSHYLIPALVYVGAGAGMRIERGPERGGTSDDESTTMHLVDSEVLAQLSLHAGFTQIITRSHYLVMDASLAQSVGPLVPWTAGFSIGVITFF